MRLSKATIEKGAVLIVLLFLLGLGLTTYLLVSIDTQQLARERQYRTMQSLGEAKAALMAWAVNNSVNLGQLPFPDRAGGGGYDGFSDCLPSGARFREPESYAFLMGKLPVYGQTLPCVGQQVGLGLDNNEHLENRLWYAVSRNVVHQYEYLSNDSRSDPVINPSIIHHPAYPWLKVLDHNGQLISDRVAALVIAPGENIGKQSREDGAAPNQFLDAFYKEGHRYANDDYDSPDEDFVMGESTDVVGTHDTRFRQPYLFNDQLVYITADELVSAVNKRVLAESKWLLRAYADEHSHYPNAADLTAEAVLTDVYASGEHQQGFVPFDVTDRCRCLSATQCACHFDAVASVTLYRHNGTWNSVEDTGACTSTVRASGKACTCTNAGSCNRTYPTVKTRFVCDADGLCETQNLSNSTNNTFTYQLSAFADFHRVSGHCQIGRDAVKCNGAGDVEIGLKEAKWLKQNDWQQYSYYAWSPTGQLEAGTQRAVEALLISTGQPLVSEIGVHQSRPSSAITDYLDSEENTDGDAVYESVLKRTSAQYNDSVSIVAP